MKRGKKISVLLFMLSFFIVQFTDITIHDAAQADAITSHDHFDFGQAGSADGCTAHCSYDTLHHMQPVGPLSGLIDRTDRGARHWPSDDRIKDLGQRPPVPPPLV